MFLAIITSGIEIQIVQADLVNYQGDGLVVPTNSDALMVDGIAARVRRAAGNSVEKEATASAPIAVGAAVVTRGGALKVQCLIHVPVIEEAGMRIGIENVRRATRAGLLAAQHFQLEQIAIPGIGYGENGIPYDETARAILDEIRAFRGSHPTSVILVDTDPSMVEAFRTMLEDR